MTQPERKAAIVKSLVNWHDKSSNSEFNRYFSKQKGFQFVCYYSDKTDYNVYLGINLNPDNVAELVAHVLPEEQDTLENAISYTCTSNIVTHFGAEQLPITEKEALKRINKWHREGYNWLEENGAFFKAISIPYDDFKPNENLFTVYFGLKEKDDCEPKSGTLRDYDFDLILARKNEIADITTNQVFLDTVRLIPPFKPANSYLLSLIPEEIILF